MTRRLPAAVIAAATGAALLFGLGQGAVAAPAKTEPPALDWTSCATQSNPTLECATLAVPLDYANPGGQTIKLALSRVKHTSETYQGPLLVNPGGPGGSGLGLAGFVARSLPPEVAGQYDVIGFDPRGVGKSEPALDCQPGLFDPVRPDPVPATAAIEKANLDRVKTFAQACGTKYGALLKHINTPNAVRDMDAIRAALGAPTINYFGYSYGTYLGQVYGKMFPSRVRRMVLDSIVDPTGVWYDDNLDQDYAFDKRHKALMAWIAKYDGTYHLGTDPAAIERKWYDVRKALATEPAGGKVGPGEFEDSFIPGGYYNGYWPLQAQAFAAYVNDGDAGALVDLYESLAAVDSGGDNGFSVYAAVQCRDAAWPKNWNTWRRDNWKVHRTAPFMAWNNAWYNAACAYWPTSSLRPTDTANSKLPPVLLFQATLDAATPYPGGIKTKQLLRGSKLVVETGGGNHGITLSGNDCLDGYLSAYLADGTLPAGRGQVAATCAKLPDPEPEPAAAASASAKAALKAVPRAGLRAYVGAR